MRQDRLQQVICPAVMQKERALAQAPQRSGAEFVTRRVALRDSFS